MKVREAIKLIEDDGWFHVRTQGVIVISNMRPSPAWLLLPGVLVLTSQKAL